MKNVLIAVLIVVLAVAAVVVPVKVTCTLLDMKDVEIAILEENIDAWAKYAQHEYDKASEFNKEITKLKVEIVQWEVCAAERNAPTLPKPEPAPVPLTDQVQESIKGVVHLQCPQWQGSGFVVGPRLVVTARHCVEGVTDFTITTHDGHRLHATRAISDKEHDVAFIWVDDLTCNCPLFAKGTCVDESHDVVLTPLPLGNIADCVLGQSVYVIGSPYGKVNFNSLTTGIISGVDRDWSPFGAYYGWEVAFTTDSAGHPGNSGCPLFTRDGVVRGILVGGLSPVLISIMPCDLFLDNLETIELMFAQDQYQREVEVEWEWDGYLD